LTPNVSPTVLGADRYDREAPRPGDHPEGRAYGIGGGSLLGKKYKKFQDGRRAAIPPRHGTQLSNATGLPTIIGWKV